MTAPAAFLDGSWTAPNGEATWEHRNPADSKEILSTVPLADPATIRRATESVARLQPPWSRQTPDQRLRHLADWKARLAAARDPLLALMTLEVGKPLRDAEEEFHRTLAHLDSVIHLAGKQLNDPQSGDAAFHTRLRPVGNILVITPWNNPLAIPVSKIAAALAFGNGVVWKPAPQAPALSTLLTDFLAPPSPAGLPLSVVFGDKHTAAHLLDEPLLHAVTFTGSCAAGLGIARHCGTTARPLQAEMGGNNPVLIMPGADLEAVVALLMPACFSFSGQRCTAMRRLIVHESITADFTARLTAATASLAIGNPADPDTTIGPLISTAHRDHVLTLLRQETTSGACRLLTGGRIPPGWEAGAWLEPTVVEAVDPASPLVMEELFAPVLTVQSCRDLPEAIALANSVPHGLTAALFSPQPADHEHFLQDLEAGMLRINPTTFAIAPHAPFIGWKHSGLGPPEHGLWDAQFYARVQTIYH